MGSWCVAARVERDRGLQAWRLEMNNDIGKLGRLEKVDIRSVWPNEDGHFITSANDKEASCDLGRRDNRRKLLAAD